MYRLMGHMSRVPLLVIHRLNISPFIWVFFRLNLGRYRYKRAHGERKKRKKGKKEEKLER